MELSTGGLVNQTSSSEAKIALFRSLFRGREDFLAEDVGKELDLVLDAILRALSHRRLAVPTTETLRILRRGQT